MLLLSKHSIALAQALQLPCLSAAAAAVHACKHHFASLANRPVVATPVNLSPLTPPYSTLLYPPQGWNCDMWDVLAPVRAVRPVNGGPGYDRELVLDLRTLNFELSD